MQLIALVSILMFSLSAAAERWIVATVEWPPYTCSKCYRNGAAAEALRQVLEKKGISIEFVFYPWIQTQKNGGKRSFVGYFPAWKDEILPGFSGAGPLFSSPLVFLEKRDKPLVWQTLDDLNGKIFATTEGYGSTEEIARKVRKGDFKTLSVLSEESTLVKLAEGKVDGVLMDLYVGRYYLKNIFPQYQKKIAINPKIIVQKDLFFAFNKHSKNKEEQFNEALKATNFEIIVDKYLKNAP